MRGRRVRHSWAWLVAKEWRQLLASRAWWLMLVVSGPLVGVSFISAVRAYGELSGFNGTAAGVGEAFSPLVGVWAPTFSACELAAAFLLPFVVIHLVAADRHDGTLLIEVQHPMHPLSRFMAKAVVLATAWILASAPTVIAVLLWLSYGGSVYARELLTVFAGHVLNGALTIALAAAAAAVAEHPSTAAILTLSVTVGTWILDFVAAVQGGWWELAAAYTPTAMVADFQHGLIRLSALTSATLFVAGGCGIATIWTRLAVPARQRIAWSAATVAVVLGLAAVSTRLTRSWDQSEARLNSFTRADEARLATIEGVLHIDAHLAAEDPRRADLERRALSKLRRVLPATVVQYTAATTTGMFEQTSEHYGEIHYELNGHTSISRATTPDSVLENVYEVAGMSPPPLEEDDVFRGHPLPVAPRGAGAIFYGFWPVASLTAAALTRRSLT